MQQLYNTCGVPISGSLPEYYFKEEGKPSVKTFWFKTEDICKDSSFNQRQSITTWTSERLKLKNDMFRRFEISLHWEKKEGCFLKLLTHSGWDSSFPAVGIYVDDSTNTTKKTNDFNPEPIETIKFDGSMAVKELQIYNGTNIHLVVGLNRRNLIDDWVADKEQDMRAESGNEFSTDEWKKAKEELLKPLKYIPVKMLKNTKVTRSEAIALSKADNMTAEQHIKTTWIDDVIGYMKVTGSIWER